MAVHPQFGISHVTVGVGIKNVVAMLNRFASSSHQECNRIKNPQLGIFGGSRHGRGIYQSPARFPVTKEQDGSCTSTAPALLAAHPAGFQGA